LKVEKSLSLPGEGRRGNQKYRNPNGVGMKRQKLKALSYWFRKRVF
jgi:hypothetical protein